MNTYITRLQTEKHELYVKVLRLREFIESGEFESLIGTEKSLLEEQIKVMERYYEILNHRLLS